MHVVCHVFTTGKSDEYLPWDPQWIVLEVGVEGNTWWGGCFGQVKLGWDSLSQWYDDCLSGARGAHKRNTDPDDRRRKRDPF